MLNGADQRSIVRAYQRARTKCTTNTMTTLEGRKQVPMLTKGKFYVVVDPAVRIMGQDNRISVVGDDGCQIDLPRNLFGNMLTA